MGKIEQNEQTNKNTTGLFACLNPSNTNRLNTISNRRITSVQYDKYGRDVIVSYQSNNIYLLDWRV